MSEAYAGPVVSSRIAKEAARRRTFAIISHPDAGKTTITEKLLLYANAIHLAGSVKSRKASRHAVSDWMQMEQERGISVTSSVLQFEHAGSVLNLLDTPGHADFSEDTYRTLAAVDSAVMLMDHAKGVEGRTKKLFDVCRLRKVPVLTFMNKLDRAGLDPLELVDDVSASLNLKVAPITWPLGMGRNFAGVVDVKTRQVTLYNTEQHGTREARAEVVSWEEARERIESKTLFDKTEEDLELLTEAGEAWDREAFLAGELSPVFWGSAMTNFGVDGLLEFLAREAAPPAPRSLEDGEEIEPGAKTFTGFVFKIQANMNPKHRDRIAFMRVVSGVFERDMTVTVGSSGQNIRMARPQSFMAQERTVLDEAFPGDIVGIFDGGKLKVGDTVADGKRLRFAGIPRFAPEHFGRLQFKDPLKRKQLDTGLEQLAHEGVIQLFFKPEMGRQSPVLGAVGILQFEVLRERLKNEYNVKAALETLPYRFARWCEGPDAAIEKLKKASSFDLVEDRHGRPVLLTESSWGINYALQNTEDLVLHDIEPL